MFCSLSYIFSYKYPAYLSLSLFYFTIHHKSSKSTCSNPAFCPSPSFTASSIPFLSLLHASSVNISWCSCQTCHQVAGWAEPALRRPQTSLLGAHNGGWKCLAWSPSVRLWHSHIQTQIQIRECRHEQTKMCAEVGPTRSQRLCSYCRCCR